MAQLAQDIGRPLGDQRAMSLGMVCKTQHTQILIALFQQGADLFVVLDLLICHKNPPWVVYKIPVYRCV